MIHYGKQTELAIHNFGSGKLHSGFIKAYGEVKKAALSAAQKITDRFTEPEFKALMKAVDNLINGNYDSLIALPFKQGGAGTSTNMNINEVIASAASEIATESGIEKTFNPIEDINIFQSTNDTFTTALTIMAYRDLTVIEDKVIKLQEKLITIENKLSETLACGRTEMQSAVPITMGQIFGGFAGAIERDRWRLSKLKERIRNIALGGTAIGTCFNAPQTYIFESEKFLRNITGLPLCRSQNLPDEISNADKYSELANGYKNVAINLFKIAGDLLFYTSSAVNEIIHPNLQYGSTIMAAKTNPVILEFVRGLAVDVQGESLKIDLNTQNGQLQLNAYLPFIAESLCAIASDLVKMLDSFSAEFLDKMEINYERIEQNLTQSEALLNGLIPILGYDKVKALYEKRKKHNFATKDELKQFLLDTTDIEEAVLKRILDPFAITNAIKK